MKDRTLFSFSIVAGLSLLTRLAALATFPLAADEASRAWPAWIAIHGGGWPLQNFHPLLLSGNAGLFLLFGEGDGTARFLPAFAGALLALTPWLWRRVVGNRPALIAALLLLISPVALMSARRLEETAPAALALAVLAAAFWDEEAVPQPITAAALAIGLTSGPLFWDGLFALLIAVVLVRRGSLRLSPTSIRGLLYGLFGAVGIGVALGWHWGGWSAPMAGLAAWWRAWTDPLGIYARPSLAALLVGEPLTLFLSFYAWVRERHRPSYRYFLALWALLTLPLLLLHGPSTRAIALLLPPLTLLAGEGAVALWERSPVPWPGPWMQEAGYFLMGTFLLLIFAHYTTSSATGRELWMALLVVALTAMLYVGFALTGEPAFATRALVRGLAACLLVGQVGAATMSYARFIEPAEPLSWPTVAPDLHTLPTMVSAYSRLYAVTPEALEIVVLKSSPDEAMMLWSLRDFPALRSLWGTSAASPAILITDVEDRPSGNRRGMLITVGSHVPFAFPDARAWIGWILYRHPPSPPEKEQVILWWPQDME